MEHIWNKETGYFNPYALQKAYDRAADYPLLFTCLLLTSIWKSVEEMAEKLWWHRNSYWWVLSLLLLFLSFEND